MWVETPHIMIYPQGQITVGAVMLSFIIDKTLTEDHFVFPQVDGSDQKALVQFNNVQIDDGDFSISGEINYLEEMHPIHMEGDLYEDKKLITVRYRIEMRIDGDEDDDDEEG